MEKKEDIETPEPEIQGKRSEAEATAVDSVKASGLTSAAQHFVRRQWSRLVDQVMRLPAIVRWLPLIIIAAIISRFVEFPIDQAVEDSKLRPFVAVVMAQDERDFSIPLELWNGIEKDGVTIDGTGVRFRQFKPTRTGDAAAREARVKCLDDENCIAIVGGADSSTTEAILQEILAYKGQKPALIAPIATATSISEIATNGRYSSFLRMVPSNRDQARRISSFIAARAPTQRVMIISDNKNLAYVTDLREQLEYWISESGGDTVPILYEDDSFIQKIEGSGLEFTDFIVFVGTAENGKAVMASFKRNGIDTPTIFTDGNTTADALRSSVGMPGEVYFLTPVRNVDDEAEPGYTAIGRDTYRLMKIIIEGAESVDRAAIAEFVASNKGQISISRGTAGAYSFGGGGENQEMSFQIYAAEDGKLNREIAF